MLCVINLYCSGGKCSNKCVSVALVLLLTKTGKSNRDSVISKMFHIKALIMFNRMLRWFLLCSMYQTAFKSVCTQKVFVRRGKHTLTVHAHKHNRRTAYMYSQSDLFNMRIINTSWHILCSTYKRSTLLFKVPLIIPKCAYAKVCVYARVCVLTSSSN